MSPEDWARPTLAGAWNVRQVAAHLLDTALPRLSFARDGWRPEGPPMTSEADLIRFVNAANAAGVDVLGRLSPRVLIALMEVATRQLSAYVLSLDPDGRAPIGVSWAGEHESRNWFDIARELTERWHHQQQIREAVGKPGIMTPRLYGPVLDCLIRGLPHAYRAVPAPDGAIVQVRISGDCGGTWHLEQHEHAWRLVDTADASRAIAHTTIPQEIAWRVFTKGIARAEALRRCVLEGDATLARAALGMVAIVG